MTATELYYDPYDFEIDADPHPVWKRMRDEQPLYYNEKYDFFALSRFADVEAGLKDWKTYSSARGTILELIKANIDMPPGMVIFDDPPSHDIYRGLMSRIFTPRKVLALEPKIREFCAEKLDAKVAEGRFDFIDDLGAHMPMRVMGMLMGIPEQDQQAIKQHIDEGLKLADGSAPDAEHVVRGSDEYTDSAFAEYLDWRMEHPSDDLMTELLHKEFEDHNGVHRRLTRDEVLGWVRLLAAAGNETTTRLIGWTGKVLSDHPDQLRQLAADRSLVPNAIEEILRYEAPSPVQSRYVTRDVEVHGRVVPAGSVMVMINGSGNRDEREFPDADRFDIHRAIDHHLSFGFGLHFCLGAALARMEGRVALDEVLQRFPHWEVDREHAVQARTSTVRGWEHLPVVAG